MKRMKKLASLLLALVMTLAMALPVMATEADPASEAPAATGRQYEIFQIFTGEFTTNDDGAAVLSNVKWGQNSANRGENVAVGDVVTETVMNTVAGFASLDENARAAAIAEYADLNSAPITTAQGDGTVFVNGLAAGYYLVRDVPGSQDGEGQDYSLYVVEVVNETLEITPKVGTPEVEKKIVENGNKVDDNNGAIGDKVEYEIVGTMPSNIDLYNQYFYEFTDTMSKGLTYNGDLKVFVATGTKESYSGEKDITKNTVVNASEYNEVTGTVIEAYISDVKALGKIEGITINANTVIVLRYSATINDKAAVGVNGNPNKVDLTYSNNPNDSGKPSDNPPSDKDPKPTTPTGVTPEDEVITYTTELKIFKYQGNKEALPGVEFTLTGTNLNQVKVASGEEFVKAGEGETAEYYLLKDGTYTKEAPITEDTDEVKANTEYYASTTPEYVKKATSSVDTVKAADNKVTGIVGEDGYLKFTGLMAGDYVLSETKTPSGFNTIKDINITISYANGAFTVTSSTKDANGADVNNSVSVNEIGVMGVEIENKKGSLLPSTGGIGTTIFYVVGTILVLGAGILLVTKRRMKAQ